MNMSKILSIQVYSDFACPWCFVGKRRMEAAIKQANIPVQFTYHSYQIDPSVAENGEDNESYNRRRWGGSGWIDDLKYSAKKDGLTFAKWNVWCNTLKAHRLVKYTQKNYPDYTNQLVEKLFYEYFEEGKNISLIPTLNDIYKEMGLPDVTEMLKSNDMKREVLLDDQYGKRQLDISGVPFFIINDKYAVEGAQSVNSLVKILKTAYMEL